MAPDAPTAVTILLRDIRETPGPEARERLIEAVYPELRRLAGRLMRHERQGHTLQPTALVHDAYVSLVGPDDANFENRAHFFGAAARAMRRILVDHARAHAAQKRGGGFTHVPLDEALGHGAAGNVALLELDDALERLAALDPRAVQVVELRVFGGLTVPETAAALGVSARTVDGDWGMARLWLARALKASAG
jgi:RNA polymerase sigma-70 factor, ECF subfamily